MITFDDLQEQELHNFKIRDPAFERTQRWNSLPTCDVESVAGARSSLPAGRDLEHLDALLDRLGT